MEKNLVEKEIESKQKMPKEMKAATIKSIKQNLIMVLLIFVILSVMCFMDENNIKENFGIPLKILSTILVVISIVFFEIAYRKEKMSTCFWAIELLTLGMIIMFVPYLSNYAQYIILGIAIGFGIYYLAKFIAIVIKKHKDFSDEKSDVKDIVKEEEKGYLDEVSKKKFKKDGEKVK